MSYGQDAERDRIAELLGRQQRCIAECLAALARSNTAVALGEPGDRRNGRRCARGFAVSSSRRSPRARSRSVRITRFRPSPRSHCVWRWRCRVTRPGRSTSPTCACRRRCRGSSPRRRDRHGRLEEVVAANLGLLYPTTGGGACALPHHAEGRPRAGGGRRRRPAPGPRGGARSARGEPRRPARDPALGVDHAARDAGPGASVRDRPGRRDERSGRAGRRRADGAGDAASSPHCRCPAGMFAPFVARIHRARTGRSGTSIASATVCITRTTTSRPPDCAPPWRRPREHDVVAVKLTLYRTGEDSPVLRGPTARRRPGKRLWCSSSSRLSYDEARNIDGSRSSSAGAQVVYGLVGLKNHAKVALVVRREQGEIRRYAHLAPGTTTPARRGSTPISAC